MSELSQEKRDEILRLIVSESDRAIGFDDVNGEELSASREKALQYAKGEMTDMVMTLKGRSQVVSTDVADAVETVMPDLMEIFTGGDDVITFEPVAENDIEAAQQETDYLGHLVFNKNDGWKVYYESFKDALLCKTGVIGWRWEGEYQPPVEFHEGKGLLEVARAMADGDVSDVKPGEPDKDGLPTFSFTYQPKFAKGRVVIEAIPSEDLAVAPDTKTLATATYCKVRQRPRAQDLIACGYDREAVDNLPAWSEVGGSSESQARDQASETSAIAGAVNDTMRSVEIFRHYLRVYDEEQQRYVLYQVVTGGKGYADTLLDIEEISRIPLAAMTPYIVAHRFFGESLADKLFEVQRVKTLLLRMALDSANFALNQRLEIPEGAINHWTISDILQNEPGRPVRTKAGGLIKPLGSGGLPYNPLEYLEYFSTVGEERTGIVRNAQGLNPDTLHDTKGGMQILANNAMKRVRMIARCFAETGIKDFLVGLHATVREKGASMADTARLRGADFVEIDPSTWRQRDDMVIQIGVGSGGREHDLVVGQQIGAIQERLITAQSMPAGPLIDVQNLHASAMFMLSRLGVKAPERFIGDPKKFTPAAPEEPPPDPKMIEAQARIEMERERLEIEREKAAFEADLKEQEALARIELEELKIEREAELARDRMHLEMEQARERMFAEMKLSRERALVGAAETDGNEIPAIHPGGDLGV